MARQINTILRMKDEMSKPLFKVSSNVKDVTREMKKTTNATNKFAKKGVKAIDKVVKRTAKLGLALTGVGLAFSVKTAIDLQDAFSDVRKTVDTTEEGFERLRQGLNKLSTEIPVAVDELYGMASVAGQLGIAEENIVSFVDTVAKLDVATDMGWEQAGMEFARFAEIMGMSHDNFDRLGSTVVALGNNFAATESEITSMAIELAGSAKQVNMAESDVFALSTAMAAVGIATQRGGSSMSRTMQKINTEVLSGGENLGNFAKISGKSVTEFTKAWKDKPAAAIADFVEGLNDIKESGGDVTSTLKDLGISSIQEIDTLLRLSGASDTLRDSLDMASSAWKENTALQDEAAEKFENIKAKIDILKNKFILIADTLGQVFFPYIEEGIDWLSGFADKVKENEDAIASAIDKVLEFGQSIKDFIVENKETIIFIGTFVVTLYTLAKVISFVTAVTTALTAVVGIFNGTLALSNPKLLLITVVIALVVAAIVWLIRNWEDLSAKIDEVVENIRTSISNWADRVNGKIEELKSGIAEKWNALKEATREAWDNMMGKIGGVIDGIREKWEGLKEFMKNPISGTVNLIQKGVQGIKNKFSNDRSFASGTSYSPAGYARIHEEGGEIRKLSSGETIIPADKSERLLRNQGVGDGVKVEVIVYGNIYGDDEIVDKVGNTVAEKVKIAIENV